MLHAPDIPENKPTLPHRASKAPVASRRDGVAPISEAAHVKL